MGYDQNNYKYGAETSLLRKAKDKICLFQVVGLLASTVCGLVLIWANNFYLSYILLSVLLSCGNYASLLGGLCQDLFPTNLK